MKGGDHLHDFSPEKNHATIHGANWVSTKRGWTLLGDGVDDYIDTNTDDFFDVSAPLTVAAWVYVSPDFSGVEWEVFGKYDGSDGWIFRTHGDNLDLWFNGSFHTTSYTIDKGTWLHWAATWDGSDVKFYVNGSLLGTVSTTDTITASTTTLKMLQRGDDAGYSPGKLDQARIYDRVLSAQEISLLHSRTNV
nr:putative hemagglutinin/hemolysin-related protein [uncultured bacterium]